MASCMIMFYKLQVTQMNDKPPQESSLNLTLTQHPHDEDPKLRKMRLCLEVEPLQAWYYRISPNFHTLVILLQVDPTFSNEPKIVFEGFYKTENTSFLHVYQFPTFDTIVGCMV